MLHLNAHAECKSDDDVEEFDMTKFVRLDDNNISQLQKTYQSLQSNSNSIQKSEKVNELAEYSYLPLNHQPPLWASIALQHTNPLWTSIPLQHTNPLWASTPLQHNARFYLQELHSKKIHRWLPLPLKKEEKLREEEEGGQNKAAKRGQAVAQANMY